jgi:dTDP-4-dehydrorhamnose reductase
MRDLLIGHSGFVGSTLQRQRPFDALLRSTDIGRCRGQSFDTVICAAAPAQKWIANREPAADRRNIDQLIDHLRSLQCSTFVLISTVDVFMDPIGVAEDSPVDEEGLHPYGLHRRLLEKEVQSIFPKHLIARLPGLVGPRLRKNVIFDLLNNNNLGAIDSRGVFQFYPMVNLWSDVQLALAGNLSLVHLTAEPISVAEIASSGFGRPFDQVVSDRPARYDMQSMHAARFGGRGHYQYTKRETLLAVRAYAQSEARSTADRTRS